MRLEIPMTFTKTTKNKIVFATDDRLVPTSNVYLLTEYLDSRGIESKRIDAILSNVPFSDDEAERMLAMILMRPGRQTPRKTVFRPVEADAPVESLYVVSEWLVEHDFGDALYLGIADAASGYEAAASADQVEHRSPDDIFYEFLGEKIVRSEGSRITTGMMRMPWAALNDADPNDDVIGGIHKNTIARRFRKRFGAPAGKRGRVNSKDRGRVNGKSTVEYYWEGYAIREE